MRETMFYLMIGLFMISNAQARECSSNEECTECPDLVEQFKQGKMTRSELIEQQCRSSKFSGFTCCIAHKECENGETCRECPSLIDEFRNGLITRTTVLSKQCGDSRKTYCCPEETSLPEEHSLGPRDANDENSPSYLPRVEDNTCGQFIDASNIVGGEDAKPGRYPFTVVLGNKYFDNESKRDKYTWRCGGTIINRWYVLTAAHCYTSRNLNNLDKEYVNVGDYDLSEKEDCVLGGVCLPPNQLLPVQDVKNNKQFRNERKGGVFVDISLVKLERMIETNKYVKFICLPLGLPNELSRLRISNYEQDIVGVRAHAIGWGYTSTNFTLDGNEEFNFAKDIQQKVDLPILSNSQCGIRFNNKLSFSDGTRMCAGGEVGKDSCKGDSGGPLVINKFVKSNKNLRPDDPEAVWVQVGLTSFGSIKCGSGNPGVYTRISKYIDWIKENLN